MTSLVVAEHDNSELKGATLNTVAAANAISGDVHLLVAGENCDGVAEAASKVDGVAKVLVAQSAEYANAIAENLAPLVVKLAGDYSHVLAPADTFGKNLMDVGRRLLTQEGIVRGFYSGFGPILFKQIPYTMAKFAVQGCHTDPSCHVQSQATILSF